MNGWIPDVSKAQEGAFAEQGFKEGEFFGLDRSLPPPVRLWGPSPPRKRGLLERIRDAWNGLLFGWRHGEIDP